MVEGKSVLLYCVLKLGLSICTAVVGHLIQIEYEYQGFRTGGLNSFSPGATSAIYQCIDVKTPENLIYQVKKLTFKSNFKLFK